MDDIIQLTSYDGNKTVDKTIDMLLSAIVVKKKLSGYLYLKEALLYCVNTNKMYGKFTTQLYPAIALKHNTTAENVERAIRTAIHDCYYNGNIFKLNDIVKCNFINSRYAPTNVELISVIAESVNNIVRNNVIV